MAAVETTYREALRQALIDSMTADPSIFVMGEEVGRYGGAYGVTKGLLEMFGENRVIDTPIAEAGIVGAAVGAAMGAAVGGLGGGRKVGSSRGGELLQL